VIGHLIKREGVGGEADAAKLAAKNTAQWGRNQKILQKRSKRRLGKVLPKMQSSWELHYTGGRAASRQERI